MTLEGFVKTLEDLGADLTEEATGGPIGNGTEVFSVLVGDIIVSCTCRGGRTTWSTSRPNDPYSYRRVELSLLKHRWRSR